jgi:hypothetical protein
MIKPSDSEKVIGFLMRFRWESRRCDTVWAVIWPRTPSTKISGEIKKEDRIQVGWGRRHRWYIGYYHIVAASKGMILEDMRNSQQSRRVRERERQALRFRRSSVFRLEILSDLWNSEFTAGIMIKLWNWQTVKCDNTLCHLSINQKLITQVSLTYHSKSSTKSTRKLRNKRTLRSWLWELNEEIISSIQHQLDPKGDYSGKILDHTSEGGKHKADSEADIRQIRSISGELPRTTTGCACFKNRQFSIHVPAWGGSPVENLSPCKHRTSKWKI